MTMERRENGFLTYAVLAMGTGLLAAAVMTARFTFFEVKAAKDYYRAAQAAYLAESALAIGYEKCKADEKFTAAALPDSYGLTEPGDALGIRISSFYEGIMLSGYGVTADGAVAKTCSIRVVPDKRAGNGDLLIDWVRY